MNNLNLKDYTESIIAVYEKKGGKVHPDITLDIFQLIEREEDLLREYNSLKIDYPGINPTMGRMIRAHYDLVNEKSILVSVEQCKLIKNYMRFQKK